MFDFLPDIKKIHTTFDYKNYDLLIFVDFSSYDRIVPFTKNKTYFDQKNILVFDHHPGKAPIHAVVHKDVNAMSSAEILFELAQKIRNKYLDKQIATYFYLWLMTDSGNFVVDKDHERIFANALALVRLWADKTLVNNNIIRKKSLNQIKFLDVLIKRIHIQGKILFSYYEEKELKKYGIDEEEAWYGLVIIQNIEGPGLTLMLKKFDHTIKWSLRSNDNVPGKTYIDCNEIAKTFGWWGHKWAAWFTMPAQGSFSQQRKKIVDQINKAIKK